MGLVCSASRSAKLSRISQECARALVDSPTDPRGLPNGPRVHRAQSQQFATETSDGWPRASGGVVSAGDARCPVIGRVSMDLIVADVTGADVGEGDWLRLDFDLATVAAATGRSQYELLTGLGHRYARVYQ